MKKIIAIILTALNISACDALNKPMRLLASDRARLGITVEQEDRLIRRDEQEAPPECELKAGSELEAGQNAPSPSIAPVPEETPKPVIKLPVKKTQESWLSDSAQLKITAALAIIAVAAIGSLIGYTLWEDSVHKAYQKGLAEGFSPEREKEAYQEGYRAGGGSSVESNAYWYRKGCVDGKDRAEGKKAYQNGFDDGKNKGFIEGFEKGKSVANKNGNAEAAQEKFGLDLQNAYERGKVEGMSVGTGNDKWKKRYNTVAEMYKISDATLSAYKKAFPKFEVPEFKGNK